MSKTKKKQQTKNSSKRTVFVFSTLVGALSVTAALLLVLAPAPLAPTSSSSLFAVDAAPASMDPVFDTRVPVQSNRWHYVYIHQSRTTGGNALTLSKAYGTVRDHFVICNGDGAGDGEIQVGHRWNQQTAALPPRGINSIDPSCISICLVGDFDHTTPTPTQLKRLAQLTNALQTRFQIPADNILLVDQANSPASTGKYFPAAAFKQQVVR